MIDSIDNVPSIEKMCNPSSEAVAEATTVAAVPTITSSSSPSITSANAFEKKMNEQMSKGQVVYDSATTTTLAPIMDTEEIQVVPSASKIVPNKG